MRPMTAVKRDIYIEQGATWSLGLNWYHESEITPGEPGDPYWVDPAGHSARMQIREFMTATDVLLEATTEDGRIALGAGGRIEVTLSDTDTDALNPNQTPMTGVYDLEVQFPGGVVSRILQGAAVIDPNVTRT